MVSTGEQKPDLGKPGFLQPLWKIVPTRGEDEWAWFVFHTRSAVKLAASMLINGTLMAKVDGLPLLRVAATYLTYSCFLFGSPASHELFLVKSHRLTRSKFGCFQ